MAAPELTITGNLTADPVPRTSSNGKPYATFTIAYTKKRKNQQGQWEDAYTTYIDCRVWNDLARHVVASLHKGARVVAIGELTQRDGMDKQGVKRRYTTLEVEEIGASLRYADVSVQRRQSGNGSSSGFANQSERAYEAYAQAGYDDI